MEDRATIERLLDCGPDVVSVDLHADRPETYRRVMGLDRFGEVMANIEYLVAHRKRLSEHGPATALALPWIVPRLQRRWETCEDIDSFFDRWQISLGTAIIDGPPPEPTAEAPDDALLAAVTPSRVMIDEGRRRVTIFSDGSVPISGLDRAGREPIGNLQDAPLRELWPKLAAARRRLRDERGDDADPLRTYDP